ncbi:MAG: DNA polymerase III subunit [Bacteroidota bacterium]|nr:DNA polymerase III subunit [Bacteroidota bacterium]MDP4217278.1 DNA polymerase III subunit [Bacteroidota bacterium]MDP4247259.1 DNA polymerase III subunit [Bacteroidota bacterium]MDP4253962.1 DNA polymerase III subunit [Bacteroidota bacterium]MDP4258373.1 DNA polymerase III subunit [Bacteroidota bacterium]
MSFKNVIGQAETKKSLADLVQHDRLSHALLFLGNEGSGALPLALAFAQYLVCEKVDGDDACGVCPACVRAQQLIHPDIHFSYPVIPKKSGDKPVSTDYSSEWREFVRQTPYGNAYDWLQFIGAENKQGNITSQECAEIIRKLSLKSFESGYKILILWMPEYLGNEGNKLLKLIEEPPANTLFILVAENESLILPTILSRTQLVRIPILETRDIESALVERAGVPADQASRVAAISEGNYHEALQLIRHAEDDWQALLREWLNAILRTGPVAQVKWIDEIARMGRERQKQFLRYFSHLLEQAIRLRYMDPARLHIPDHERDVALRLNKMTDIARQQAVLEELDKAAYYIERNAHAKMLFHALTIKLYHILADGTTVVIT